MKKGFLKKIMDFIDHEMSMARIHEARRLEDRIHKSAPIETKVVEQKAIETRENIITDDLEFDSQISLMLKELSEATEIKEAFHTKYSSLDLNNPFVQRMYENERPQLDDVKKKYADLQSELNKISHSLFLQSQQSSKRFKAEMEKYEIEMKKYDK